MTTPKRLAIFASGTGSNAHRIIEHFATIQDVEVALILSNKASAKVLQYGPQYGIPTQVVDRQTFFQTDRVPAQLKAQGIDLIALAGFLWLIPPGLLQAFPQKIVNIHPALLPKFGGKGMYGMHVHQAVIEAGETESGITIHYTNEQYDEGEVLLQATCPVEKDDTATALAQRVLALEHHHFPRVLEQILLA